MQNEITYLVYDGGASFEAWLEMCEKKLKKWNHGNVYFYATGCGLGAYASTKRKLEQFVWNHKEFHLIEDKEALKRGSYMAKQLALKSEVKTASQIKDLFHKITDRQYKLKAPCGCSIFISDAQEIRIMLLHPNHISGIGG